MLPQPQLFVSLYVCIEQVMFLTYEMWVASIPNWFVDSMRYYAALINYYEIEIK